jgi:hypothetical protein
VETAANGLSAGNGFHMAQSRTVVYPLEVLCAGYGGTLKARHPHGYPLTNCANHICDAVLELLGQHGYLRPRIGAARGGATNNGKTAQQHQSRGEPVSS